MRIISKIVCPLLGLLLVAVAVFAGGVDPEEVPQQPVVREKVTATTAQTSIAVSKARQVVAPVVKEVPMNVAPPESVISASRDNWLLGSRGGSCEPLANVSRKVQNIGTFKTPQEFGRQMQQRGYQAFVLDIGEVRDQEVRVKIPDLKLELTFVKAGLCR